MHFSCRGIVPTTVIMSVAIVAGCVRYEESIRFNVDGSGSISARLHVPVATVRLLRSDSSGSGGVRLLELLDARELEDRLRVEGVSIDRLERVETDSGIVVAADYSFVDLEAFRRTRGEGRDVALTEVGEGLYELTLVVASGPLGVDPDLQDSSLVDVDSTEITVGAQDPHLVRRALEAYRVRYSFELPTPVVSTPGGRVRGNIGLFEWSFAKHGLGALQPRTIRVIFRRNDLSWPTFEALGGQEAEAAAQTDFWDVID